jgi:mannose-6-phosphate isomerase class I
VRAGTVVLVPAGTLHAIGPEILLAEVQQPVDRTFRLFDYGSGRTLHVQQALEAVVPSVTPTVWHPGDPRDELRGRHLTLNLIRDGHHTVAPDDTPAVIIPVRRPVQLEHDGGVSDLAPGELRLCVSGPVHLRVGADGLGVVGRLPSP